METIMILAQAISRAAKYDIWRVDINTIKEEMVGRLWLRSGIDEYWDIHEDGSIEHHR